MVGEEVVVVLRRLPQSDSQKRLAGSKQQLIKMKLTLLVKLIPEVS